MEDILEKTTINIDSDYANYTSDSEFYVDIIDDIKNCIYIKTLKTEILVKHNYGGSDRDTSDVNYIENSIFDNTITRNVFNLGDYIYVTLNDIYRINTVSKKTTPLTFNNIPSNKNNNNYALKWTKVDKTPKDYDIRQNVDYKEDLNNINNYLTVTNWNKHPNIPSNAQLPLKQLPSVLENKAKQNTALTTETLNNVIYLTENDIVNICGFTSLEQFKNLINEESYFYRVDGDIVYKYVPTDIGYTKDNEKMNKYTWKSITSTNSIDDSNTLEDRIAEAEKLKYVYNSGGILINKANNNKAYNYIVQKEEFNTLKYYDSIYINKPTIHVNYNAEDCYILSYKQELTGTSCGPNDTNTMVLNPILPELKRFNVKLWRINEYGEHVEIPIEKDGMFRVIMSFTIYYKRKKVTRV